MSEGVDGSLPPSPAQTTIVLPALLSLLLLSPLVGTGCSSITGEDPPLADTTFAQVLTDLHMTTARSSEFTRLPPAVTDSVLHFHGVRREDFDATLRYYTRHPDAFASLYNAVIDTLSALRNRTYQRRTQSPTSPDSARYRPSATDRDTP